MWEGLLRVFRLPNENSTGFSYSTTSPVTGSHLLDAETLALGDTRMPSDATSVSICPWGAEWGPQPSSDLAVLGSAQPLPHTLPPLMGSESELDTAGDAPWHKQVVPYNTGGKMQPPAHTASPHHQAGRAPQPRHSIVDTCAEKFGRVRTLK